MAAKIFTVCLLFVAICAIYVSSEDVAPVAVDGENYGDVREQQLETTSLSLYDLGYSTVTTYRNKTFV